MHLEDAHSKKDWISYKEKCPANRLKYAMKGREEVRAKTLSFLGCSHEIWGGERDDCSRLSLALGALSQCPGPPKEELEGVPYIPRVSLTWIQMQLPQLS